MTVKLTPRRESVIWTFGLSGGPDTMECSSGVFAPDTVNFEKSVGVDGSTRVDVIVSGKHVDGGGFGAVVYIGGYGMPDWLAHVPVLMRWLPTIPLDVSDGAAPDAVSPVNPDRGAA